MSRLQGARTNAGARSDGCCRLLLLLLAAQFLAAGASGQPFAVGHKAVTYVDPARANRNVQTEIYYPAGTAGDNVPVAGGTFPVIAFGHGYLMPWSVYEYVWAGLVPLGFIVALPRTEGSLLPDHGAFGLDLAFLIGKLRSEGANPSSAFYGHVGSRSAVMGHSMGGGASFLALQSDPTVTVIANLAAAETNPSAIAAASTITTPALLFAGSYDCVTPPAEHQIPMYGALASPCKTLVNVTGASHCQFAAYNFSCSLGEGACQTPAISRAEQHALTLQILVPWLDCFLKEDASGWLAFQELIAAGAGISSMQSCATVAIPGGPSPVLAPSIGLDLRPNPFVDSTTLTCRLTVPGRITLGVHDLSGRTVRLIFRGALGTGVHEWRWDGADDAGRPLPSGAYICRLQTPAGSSSATTILIR